MPTHEICKDLAYSYEQLTEFLTQMQGVSARGNFTFNYGDVSIRLEPQPEPPPDPSRTVRLLPRCYMFLQGDEAQIKTFYHTFMLYHMTMGG